jgi:hypothetical protein
MAKLHELLVMSDTVLDEVECLHGCVRALNEGGNSEENIE